MRTCCTAQGTLQSVFCGDLNGKEIQRRGDICIRIADLHCCTIEIISNYTPIKI